MFNLDTPTKLPKRPHKTFLKSSFQNFNKKPNPLANVWWFMKTCVPPWDGYRMDTDSGNSIWMLFHCLLGQDVKTMLISWRKRGLNMKKQSHLLARSSRRLLTDEENTHSDCFSLICCLYCTDLHAYNDLLSRGWYSVNMQENKCISFYGIARV